MKSWVLCMALGGIMVGASTVTIVQNITLGVHFVCDTSLVKAREEKKHTTALEEYLSIFLYAVELYLRESECPTVKLVLTGVYKSTVEEESLFEKTEYEFGVKTLDPTFTLGMFQIWVQSNIKFEDDDVVFLLTSLQIDDHVGHGISKNGYSYFNEICSLGVGLVHDSGFMFDGVVYMAQQIAHMLGFLWDISEKCPERGKTLMATVSGPRGLSECSKEAFRQQYNNYTMKDVCWKKNLKPDVSFNWSLPATYFRKENYCSTRHSHRVFQCPEGNPNYVADATKCSMGCCVNNTEDASGFKYSVPDGTPCGQGKICIYAICTEFSEKNNDWQHST
uniref:Putative secreted metalloprotease n=1 Tax=Ixodes ricinus TaxID=34613 RepID=A0A6B0VB13_IXORI